MRHHNRPIRPSLARDALNPLRALTLFSRIARVSRMVRPELKHPSCDMLMPYITNLANRWEITILLQFCGRTNEPTNLRNLISKLNQQR